MKVLLTIADLDGAMGGPQVLVTRLASALVEAGAAVSLMHGNKPGSNSLAVPEGVKAHSLPWQPNPWRRYRAFRAAVIETIREDGIEVVHDHGLWLPENAGSAAGAAAQRRPWIVQPCGMLQSWSLAQQRGKKRVAWALYQRRCLASASAVIAASASEARDTSARLPIAKPLHCVAHGVDQPVLDGAARQRQAVFLGRLHPVKQVDVLLAAWAALRPEGWTLQIAGGGEPDDVAALHAQAASLGLVEPAVRFLGPVHGEAKRALLAGSQLFLQPSQQENFGLAVAEALAHGLPALTTRAMPWSALPGAGCGWSVASNADAVTAALREALSLSPATLATMGEKARRFASQFSWAETARQTLAVYASAQQRQS